MSRTKGLIPAKAFESLGEASHLQILDSGVFDVPFYQWLLSAARNGRSVELILSESASPDTLDLSALYFHHLTTAGAQVYSYPNAAGLPAFLLTERMALLPENTFNTQTKPVFRTDENPAAIARLSALFQQCKTDSSIRSAFFQPGADDKAPSSGNQDKAAAENIEIRFAATPNFIQVNQRFELNWDVKGASRVQIEPLLGELPVKGSRILSAEQSTEFRLYASNKTTQLSATAQVTIDPTPKIEYVLSVPSEDKQAEEQILNPDSGKQDHFGVVKGTPLRLYWRCYNTEKFSLDGQEEPLKGNRLLLNDGPRVYLLKADGNGRSVEVPLLIDVFQRPEIERLQLPNAATVAINTQLQWPEQMHPSAGPKALAGHLKPPSPKLSEPPPSLSHRIRNFFWFCAGINPELLAAAPASESAKFTGIGGAVFFTGLLAALSGGYALYTAFQNVVAALLFGLLWGALIFNLDRLIVASMKKEPNGDNQWLQALPRFLLALVLSIVIAKPLELRIFKPEIDAILVNSKRAQTNRLEAMFDLKGRKITERIAGIKAETAGLFQIRETLYQEYRCECDGTCGTGKTGRGSECARKEAKYLKADQEYQALKTENDRLIAVARQELDAIAQNKKNEVQQWADTRTDGLIARIDASSELPLLPGLFIMLLILMVEIAPVLSKLLTPAGVYEAAVRLAETRFVVGQEALTKQEQAFVEQQSSLHVRLHETEINEEVDQKAAVMRLIAEAQLQLVKDQVADWLEKEREKKKS